jgi:hypothetical protein
VAIRDTQDVLIFEVPTLGSAKIHDTQDALLFEIPIPAVTISYPLTPPTQLGPQQCKVRMVSVVGETVSPFTGNQQEQQWPAQWWELDISLPPMMRATSAAIRSADKRYTAELWTTFLAALNGKYGTFLQGDPNASTPAGIATGSPVVISGGASVAPNNVISTTGWTPSQTGILLAGDYIQLQVSGSPQRLYKNLFDANSDAGGNATLTVFPMVHEAIPGGTMIVVSNPKGTFRLKDNASEFDIDRARVYGISFSAKEAF